MEQFTRFSDDEYRRLDDLVTSKTLRHPAGTDIIAVDTHSSHCHVLLSGLACRYTILADGTRQIMAFLVPGDLCDAEIFILKTMDHSVGALVPTVTATIHANQMKSLLREVSNIAEALWWGTLTDLGVLRERIVDHGRRDAHERIAHLLYELLVRHRIVGLADGDVFDFPITQVDLADATGLTPAHVNRVLQRLRGDGLIETRDRTVAILDAPRLRDVSGFNPNYLHLDRVHDTQGGLAERAGDLV